MIGHYSLSYWGSSNIFWAFKQAEYANALRNFIWIFFTLHDTNLFSNRPTNKESDIVLYMERKKKKKKKENLRLMTSQQQCREQLVRYWKLWSVWFQKKINLMKMKNVQWVQIMFMNISDALWQADEMYVNKKL